MNNENVEMEQKWYVIYTKRDAETELRDQILTYSQENLKSYQAWVPLTIETKQWSDRKKRKQVPLFRNYLFVKHDVNGFEKIRSMHGFTEYVRFGKYPSVMPEIEISKIKTILDNHANVSCKPKNLVKGVKVRIRTGALANYEGILVEDQRNSKVAIEIKNLQQYLHVNIPISNVIKI